LEQRKSPQSNLERQEMLKEAPGRIHDGLVALRHNRGCTAGFMMFSPKDAYLTYCTAGHPGILLSRNRSLEYLATQGTRPGFVESSIGWDAQTVQLEKGETAHLISDGIVPPGDALARWLKKMKRQQQDAEKSLSRQILGQIKQNRSSFRADRTKEDDMTVVILMRTS
jgi:serine phosphatase RsbU (regulator of sigma subunit)